MTGGIAEILATSAANNLRDNITGVLIYDERWFAQVLEGAEAGLSPTFERILRDQRHSDVSLVTMQPVAERRYPDFAMSRLSRGEDNDDLFRHYCEDERFDPRQMRADRLADLIEAVVDRGSARGDHMDDKERYDRGLTQAPQGAGQGLCRPRHCRQEPRSTPNSRTSSPLCLGRDLARGRISTSAPAACW